MEKKNLIFGFVFILLIAGLVFVFAALDAPDDLIFYENTTPEYDNDGTVFLNWSEVTNVDNYTLFIYADDVMFTSVKNSSTSSYIFINTTDANYTFTVQAENATAGQEKNSTNISLVVDDTNPTIEYASVGTEDNSAHKSQTWIFVNVSGIYDLHNDTISYSLYNSSGLWNQTNFTDSYVTSTINWTGLVEGTYTYNVTANDSATNTNSTTSRNIILDTSTPSLSLSASSSSRTSLTISISGAEGTCTASGSGTRSISDSTLTVTGLSCGNSYDYVVTCTDSAGNAGSSSSTSFSTSGCGSSSSSSTTLSKEIHSWLKITPGVAAIMKNFDKEIGVKQIQIEVNNEAQNVKITVTKHEGKPAEVSVEKSGKTYRYLYINAENLEGKLERATIRMQVEKSWVVANGFEIDEMAMFKFNENSGKWNELDTAYVEADDEYYYYDAEVDSFSYFAISEKVVVDDEEDGVGEEEEEELEKKGLGWWWAAIIVGIIIIAYLISVNKKEISKLFKK